MALARFGVSLEEELLAKFDRFCAENRYTNRSEAIRDLIRETLVRREWAKSRAEVAGVASIVYDHHKRELVDKLIDIQHEHQALIISTQHAHLSHDNCIEVMIIRGSVKDAKDLVTRLRSTKGVKHAEFIMTTTGEGI